MNAKPLSALIFAALASAAVAQTPAATSSPSSVPTAPTAPAPDPAKLAPSEIVAAAPASEWVSIAPEDMLVMTLVGGRRVVIQLMPPPFSQGWIGNIRKLAAAHWWDGLSINRVQDNYVVQWGDAEGEDPAKARALPSGLRVVPESEYANLFAQITVDGADGLSRQPVLRWPLSDQQEGRDAYSREVGYLLGWPVATDGVYVPPLRRRNGTLRREGYYDGVSYFPVHCYGMVGVGRNLSPDTGSGAELYTVIGHAPRHLDRNIAVVGRVISGIENLSSLPRGTGALGFYEKPEERVGITSIRLASELAAADQPRFEYLSTESASFSRYANARANRRDAFFNIPAGGADICNIPVPIRKKP